MVSGVTQVNLFIPEALQNQNLIVILYDTNINGGDTFSISVGSP
jgi:hypothetical protein